MANLSFNEVNFDSNTNNPNQIGFFNLSNDGDEAVVRFMQDTVESFDIVSVHDIKLGNKYRKINCLRNPSDPITSCPLCARGDKLSNRIFIKLIEYVKNEDGTVTALPRVWERSVNYAKTLRSYIDNYGPLSDIICKIIRHGASGSMQTTYEIVPNLNKAIYPDNVYVKITEPFEGYKALGRVVLDRDFNDMKSFVDTGVLPEKKVSNNVQPQPQNVPQYNNYPQQNNYIDPNGQRFIDDNGATWAPMNFPSNNQFVPQQQVNRPNRTY